MKSPVKANQRQRVYARDGYKCLYCGFCLRGLPSLSTVDHIIPQSLGGSHADDNLRTACKGCNSTKRDRSEQWLRLFMGFRHTRYAQAISMGQYFQLVDLGAVLDPIPAVAFFYESPVA